MKTIKGTPPKSKRFIQRKMNSISLMMITLSALISTTFSGYDYYYQRKILKQNFEEICAPIPSQIAGSLGKPLWFGDIGMTKELIEAQMSQKRIFAIVVKENESVISALSRDHQWNTVTSDGTISGKFMIRKEQIIYESKPLGEVEVYFTTRFEDELLRKQMYSLVIQAVLLSVILVFALLAVVSSLMIKPIIRIASNLEQIGNEVSNSLAELNTLTERFISGANRQASAIEETSASIEELSSIMSQNTDHVNNANDLMIKTFDTAIESRDHMANLTASIENIIESSNLNRRIIKTVDNIAFQTKILALNAAVEAARSGASGASFAVVSEEVKSLAGRSTEAAENSAELIEDSIQKISRCRDTAAAVNALFSSLSDNAKRAKDSLSNVTSASHEEMKGINEINSAMIEIDKVTQENMCHIEAAGSAFHHISSQIEAMRKEITRLLELSGAKKKSGSLS